MKEPKFIEKSYCTLLLWNIFSHNEKVSNHIRMVFCTGLIREGFKTQNRLNFGHEHEVAQFEIQKEHLKGPSHDK